MHRTMALEDTDMDDMNYMDDMDSKMRRKMRELDHARWIFTISTIVVCVLLLIGDAITQQSHQWAYSPSVKLDNTGGPYASIHVESAIEEVIWLWSSRMPEKEIKYIGLTLAPIENAVITYKWASPLDHFLLTGNLLSPAAEQKWIYVDNGLIARSVIHLNTAYFRGGIDRCQMKAFSHEFGHSMGADGHSENAEDLMFWAPSHCRYAPTDNDILMTGYSPSTCHSVLTRENDIFVPDIAGQQAYLRYQGEHVWKLEYTSEQLSRSCRSAEFDRNTGTILLHDLQSSQHRYFARLESIGIDTWRLNYAESLQGR